MAKGNKGTGSGSGSGDDQNTQDGANADNSGGSELDLSGESEGQSTEGNSTPTAPVAGREQQGTGAKSIVAESGAGRAASVPGAKAAGEEETKEKWLDAEYAWKGKSYGPSRYPGNLITVPGDFPDDKGGEEPTPEQWAESVRGQGTSAVVETPTSENNGVL